MKKIIAIATTLFALLILASSCQDRKTYADYLKDESRAIDLFISKHNLTILDEFPEDGQFGDNDFYKDKNSGVYFNIIEVGDTTLNLQWKEEVYVRFSGLEYFMTGDTTRYSNMNSVFPEEIVFIGPVNSNTKGSYSTPGWIVPLGYVGHNGKVKMIVPFDMGSSYDKSQYQPTYYDRVLYKFESRY
ncbi:MAG: DUF4827 domain-containing protein [Bacteroidales bacterium]|jgi:hypothetical protein|nr:DUF4827 domain-containing protein [Bacteroidales bacterium]